MSVTNVHFSFWISTKHVTSDLTQTQALRTAKHSLNHSNFETCGPTEVTTVTVVLWGKTDGEC
jgi:hypothetical protein